jgi:hypothetical protein
MRTPKLNHEVGDHTMEMKAIVKAAFCQVDEVLGRDWHRIKKDFGLERAFGGVKGCDGVAHGISK